MWNAVGEYSLGIHGSLSVSVENVTGRVHGQSVGLFLENSKRNVTQIEM